MFSTTGLLTTLTLALYVSANPIIIDKAPVTLPIARRLNSTSVHNLLRHDQNRARFLQSRNSDSTFDKRAVISEQVDNQAVTYVATVGVGSPATNCMFASSPCQIFSYTPLKITF